MVSIILDSSNTKLTVALANETKVIEEINYEAWQQQSEYMIPEIDKLLEKYSINKNDIKDVMVSIGPGSYTGVRIAITIAKVMGTALNIPVYPVSSLRVLKNGNKPSICVINARSKRSYVGVYDGNNIIQEDSIMTNEELLKYIEEHPDYTLCGNTSYLGKEGYKSSVANEMLNLKSVISPCEDVLGLKPVYMKD